jgi:alkylhydroperoxidase family enzyme
MDIGSAVGRRQGITEQQLLDLPHFETSPAFSELEKLVLRYAVAITQTPVDVSDELFTELQQRLNPRQMVELTSAIAWENYRARFGHAFGAEAEGFSAGAVCPVAVGGTHGA